MPPTIGSLISQLVVAVVVLQGAQDSLRMMEWGSCLLLASQACPPQLLEHDSVHQAGWGYAKSSPSHPHDWSTTDCPDANISLMGPTNGVFGFLDPAYLQWWLAIIACFCVSQFGIMLARLSLPVPPMHALKV